MPALHDKDVTVT